MKLQDIFEVYTHSRVNKLKQELYTAIEYMGDSQQKSQEFLDAFDALEEEVGTDEAHKIFKVLKQHHTKQNATGAKNNSKSTHPEKRTGAVQ